MNKAKWTEEEIEMLRREYATANLEALERRLGRRPKAVANMAHRLGLRREAQARKESRIRGQNARRAMEEGIKQEKNITIFDVMPPTTNLATRKRALRDIEHALAAHGVEEPAASLAAHLIVAGKLPGVRFQV